MFKGFQLKGIDYSGIQKYKQYAEELYDEYDEHIQASLDSYLSVDGEIMLQNYRVIGFLK